MTKMIPSTRTLSFLVISSLGLAFPIGCGECKNSNDCAAGEICTNNECGPRGGGFGIYFEDTGDNISGDSETSENWDSNVSSTDDGSDTMTDEIVDTGSINSSVCDVFDEDKVYLLGVLHEGNGLDSLALPEQPTKNCSHIPSHDAGFIRPSDGAFIYIEWNVGKLRVFNPDKFFWDDIADRWKLPQDPQSNDIEIQNNCGPDKYVQDFLINAETSEVYYRCSNGDAFYDSKGVILQPADARFISIGFGGFKLASRIGTSYEAALVDSEGNPVQITGVQFDNPLAVRARPDGFRVALAGDSDSVTLWHVATDGQATPLGDFADPPDGHNVLAVYTRLNAEGDLYQASRVPGSMDDLIIKRPLSPGTTTVVYTEADRPAWAQDYESTPPRTYLMMHASYLVTGP